jgi:predicted metal-dependent enzyme (double-stranded beta helix superfamily)
MSQRFDKFCADCRKALVEDPGPGGREKVRQLLETLLRDEEFVKQYCDAMPYGAHELYRDEELNFVVLSHVYSKARKSPPHDHGESWAVYGQARGHTDMTEWQRSDGEGWDGAADIKVARRYRLDPAMAGVFGPGAIHQIDFCEGASFVRVTGTDLSGIRTRRFVPEERKVVSGHGLGPGPER